MADELLKQYATGADFVAHLGAELEGGKPERG